MAAGAGDARDPSRVSWFLTGPMVVVLSLILFAEANYVAARHYRRWDWTAAHHFTLSSRSRQIVRGLKAPTDLYVLLARGEEQYTDVAELAERYASESPRLRLHFIDPDRQRERLLGLAQELNLQLVQSAQGDRTLATAGLVAARGTRHWEVTRESLRELGAQDPSDEQGVSRLLNAKITVERAISEALVQVDQSRPTRLCVSQGHAEMPIASGDRAGSGFTEALRHQNFQVREVTVHGQTDVPDDCDALVIAGAQRAWSQEDAQAVSRYLHAGGNVAVFVDLVVLEGRVVPTGLEGLAREAGIAMPAAVTVEADADHLAPNMPPVHFRVDSWNEHELTRDLRGSSLEVAMVRPLQRAEASEVVPASLAQTTTHAWGETSIRELLRTWTPVREADDVAGPVSVAMASEVRGATRRSPEMPAGRVVFVGTSQVLAAPYFTLSGRATVSNASFVEASVGWLTARRELVNIPSRPISRSALLVNPADLRNIRIYVILLIPLAAALVGVAVWRARRAS